MTDILSRRRRSSGPPRARLGIARGSGGRSRTPEVTDGTDAWAVRHPGTRTAGSACAALVFLLAWLLGRRQTMRRHRAQACRVRLRASPKAPGSGQLEVANDSDQPVHAALVRPVRIRAERSRRTVWLAAREVTLTVENPVTVGKTLWPGSSIPIVSTAPDETPVLYFRNARGYTWVRDARGHLREIDRVRERVSGRWS